MSKLLKMVGLVTVVGLIGVLVFGVMVFAQGPQNDGNPNGDNYGRNYGRSSMMQRGGTGMVGGMMGGFMQEEGYHDEMHAGMAEALGLTVDELDAAMAEGKTMFDIATDQGVEWADVWAAMDAARQAGFDKAVEDGTLSQEQADWMGQRGHGRSGMRGAGGTGACGGYSQLGTVQ